MEVINYLLGYENLKIYQNTDMFNFSLDSVLLPNFVTINRKTKRILDIGSGNAVIPIILSTKTDALIDAVEIQKEVYKLGVKSIKLNKLEDRINIYNEDIKDFYKTQNCVMLGINGSSENTKIEIDHKDGRKEDLRVSNSQTQKFEDFQPLCKAANDVKRQICKRCKETNKRWDAKNIKGNPYSFYDGDENYTNELGCKGCYQYDPVEYRKTCTKMISKEASEHTIDYIMNKFYPNE